MANDEDVSTDYSSVIHGMFGSEPAANVTSNIDVNPDESARAYALEKATGVPASIIQGDLPNFERNSKAQVANTIVSNNMYINDFVQRHPLNSQLFNDSYGQLDQLSDGLSTLGAIHKALSPWSPDTDKPPEDPLHRFTDGGRLGSWVGDDFNHDHPLAAAVLSGVATPLEVILRGIAGTAGTIADLSKDAAKTLDPVLGKGFGKEIGDTVEAELMGMTGRGHLPGPEAMKPAMPWLLSGEEPPAGVHPLVDQIKAERNKTALDTLEQKVAEAKAVPGGERAPEMLTDFVKQHVEDANIEIHGPTIAALYGEKLPEANDGLLGWVPNLREQLEATKETGADITIPMADWITKVDPEVAKNLHDFIRAVPGGITEFEAKAAAEAPPPIPMVNETIPVVRGTQGYEPMFALGDRKLELKPSAKPALAPGEIPDVVEPDEIGMHNESGQRVGDIHITPFDGGKKLYVDMINGIGEYYNPNNFGPALMRSIVRQLKDIYPQAEHIGGYRVTGARGEAGAKDVWIKLAEAELNPDKMHNDIKGVMNGAWMQIYPGYDAYVKPSELFTQHEQELTSAVDAEISRLTGKDNVIPAPVQAITGPGGTAPRGLYQYFSDQSKPIIAYAINHNDAIGVARHEAIHALRQLGLFKPSEWKVLDAASKAEGWREKFGIEERYSHVKNDDLKTEESVAEAFRQWKKEKESGQSRPQTAVDRIFQKLDDFLEAIRAHIRQIMGKDPTFEELFSKIDSGEIATRGGLPQASGEPMASMPPLEPGTGTDVQPGFRASKDVGMNLKDYRNYMRLIEARQKSDLATSSRRAIAEQTKTQTADWKSKAEAMRPDVTKDLNARPDVAADKFLAQGELGGKKLENSYKLDRESLTPAQLESLPTEYLTGRMGVKPDDIAHLFGYQTGDQLVSSLAKFNNTRKASGMGRDRFQRQLIQTEIDRRMEIEHGFLQKNIMEEALDQVLSANQLDLLHEETHHLAELAGTTMGNITRDQLTTQIKSKFDDLPMRAIDSAKWLREAGKHGKNAESFLLQNNAAEAFKAKQAQYYNSIYADFARRTEKERAKLDKSAKAFRKSDVKNVEPEYLNHIQSLLAQMGYKVGRSLENIQENLTRRQATLEQFADAKLSESFGLRDIPVADVIVDKKLRAVDDMSTAEFLGAKQTVDALVKNAKDEFKIYREGATADRNAVLKEMGDHVEEFPLKPINTTPTRWNKLAELPRQFLASVTTMETFLNRLGNRDPLSVFNKYITYPAAAAANRKSALQRQFAKAYRTIGELEDPDKLVVAPFIDPTTGQPFVRFTRANIGTMLQNAGNRSNWEVLAKGYGADPAKLMDWLVANTRPADWTRAQKLGKDVFGELVKLADNEYEHIHGITIDKIPLEPISNIHGTFEGWYHPLIKHPNIEGKSPIRDGAYDDGDFGHITTSNGYTKKRSGAAYPLDLNPDMTPVRMNQMIHDISFRSFILETQKLFKDPTLSNKITGHYGAEYNGRNFLVPWLKDIAGQESIPSQAARSGRNLSEMLRQNVISTYIGFNPFTAFKHGPTALVMSSKSVGLKPFLRAVQDLYARSPSLTGANHDFVMQWSEELQRRERHWQDTLFGAHQEIEGSQSLRQSVIEKGSWLVAKSDMFSAKPTWLAAYRDAQSKGQSHGDSIDLADAAVRDAHGSTAVTNQPTLVRGGGALHNWLTSVYGFFGTVMQRRIELCQDIHDTWGLFEQNDISGAANKIPGIVSDVMAYVIWPTLVEEFVTGLTTDDKRGWVEHAATAGLLGLSSSVLYARDIVHGILSGQDVGVGLISSPLHDLVKAAKDLGHKDAFTKARMGKTVGDTLTAIGHGTGMAPKTIDNAVKFGIDLVNHQAHPKGIADILRGVTKGQTQPRQEK